MKKILRLLSAVSMIAGTSIGAAMVAMPIAMAKLGTVATCVLLLLTWVSMLVASFFMLESNTYHDKHANLVTMSQKSLGSLGYWLCVTAYLLLLYCLNAAYLAEFSAGLMGAFALTDLPSVLFLAAGLAFVFFLAPSRWSGQISQVMLWALCLIYFLIVSLLFGPADTNNIHPSDWGEAVGAFPICILAFGYQIIIPSLRRFLEDDIILLRRAIYIGSFIPLLVYLAWMLLVMFNMPSVGDGSLQSIANNSSLRDDLPLLLARHTNIKLLEPAFNWFVIFAVSTSLFGASVSLFDFVKDWLKRFDLTKSLVAVIAFLPPAVCVLFFPKLFMIALRPAGLLVGVLLMLLPVANCIAARSKNMKGLYQVPLMVPGALFVCVTAGCMILLDVVKLFS